MQNTYVRTSSICHYNSTPFSIQFLQHNTVLNVSNESLTLAPSLCAVMAQILSIYGLVCAVIMSGDLDEIMPLHTGFLQFGAGIAVGLCGLAAGFAIGVVGDAGGMFLPHLDHHSQQPPSTVTLSHVINTFTVRASSQQPRLYTGMVLILIFSEVLGLYGVVVSILMLTKSKPVGNPCQL